MGSGGTTRGNNQDGWGSIAHWGSQVGNNLLGNFGLGSGGGLSTMGAGGARGANSNGGRGRGGGGPAYTNPKPKPPAGLNMPDFLQYANLDPNGVFSTTYEGLKDLGMVGLASMRDADTKMANIKNLMAQSGYQLQDEVGGHDRAYYDLNYKEDRGIFDNGLAALLDTDIFLLNALKDRNNQRAEQNKYYNDQYGIIAQSVKDAKAASDVQRQEGTNVNRQNRREILRSGAANGALFSVGRGSQESDQTDALNTLMSTLKAKDENTWNQAVATQRDVKSFLDRIKLAGEEDVRKTQYDIKDISHQRSDLKSNWNKNGIAYMRNIANLNAEAAARKRDRDLAAQAAAAENSRALAAYSQGQNQASLNALGPANAAGTATRQQQADYLRGLNRTQLNEALTHAFYTGNGQLGDLIRSALASHGW
jgi:hypothetical protein